MKRRDFLKSSVAAAASALPRIAMSAPSKSRPNIIYILADDLGYGDLGCYGQKLIETPNIDRIAAEGMKFTQHYSGSALCAPARCVLITGLHTGHCPIRNNRALAHEGNVPIPKSYVTLGEVMKKAGYATGAFGKWGLGFPGSQGDPVNRGFDHFFGYNCQRQAHSYYPPHLWRNKKKVMLGGKKYSHDLITEEVLGFIKKHKDEPFFAYVPYTIPHTKFQVPDLGEYKQTGWQSNHKIQAAMISRMDRDVGRVMALVKQLGLDERTLIIFTSDNGPHGGGGTLAKFNAAGPLRAKKGSLYEGGIRVPMVARWPGRIKTKTTSDLISCFQDVMPTFAEIASATPPANIDGISFLPTLTGQGTQKKHEYLYWELGGRQAVRMGNWKAVRGAAGRGKRRNKGKPADKPARGGIELYDLAADLAESRDVAAANPAVVRKIAGIFRTARTPSKLFPNKALDGA